MASEDGMCMGDAGIQASCDQSIAKPTMRKSGRAIEVCVYD
jgi:hypothetical protein